MHETKDFWTCLATGTWNLLDSTQRTNHPPPRKWPPLNQLQILLVEDYSRCVDGKASSPAGGLTATSRQPCIALQALEAAEEKLDEKIEKMDRLEEDDSEYCAGPACLVA